MAAAVFFDVDGTLTRTTLLDPLIWYQRARLPRWRFNLWALGLIAQVPLYLWLDRRSRSRFNVLFYRRYQGLNADELRAWHRRTFADNLQRRVFPAAVECLRDHERQGRRVVLVTGALDLVVRPLAEFVQADDLIAMNLVEQGGLLTGEPKGPPIAERQKAALVRAYAVQHGLDLGQSFAYGNDPGDVPMLECVGHPVVVNPGGPLKTLASQRGWRVVTWGLT